jgi:hypothetical protein
MDPWTGQSPQIFQDTDQYQAIMEALDKERKKTMAELSVSLPFKTLQGYTNYLNDWLERVRKEHYVYAEKYHFFKSITHNGFAMLQRLIEQHHKEVAITFIKKLCEQQESAKWYKIIESLQLSEEEIEQFKELLAPLTDPISEGIIKHPIRVKRPDGSFYESHFDAQTFLNIASNTDCGPLTREEQFKQIHGDSNYQKTLSRQIISIRDPYSRTELEIDHFAQMEDNFPEKLYEAVEIINQRRAEAANSSGLYNTLASKGYFLFFLCLGRTKQEGANHKHKY